MSTLSRRATPAQELVLRMVRGACVNAADAHPQWKFDRRLIPSISKRAAGTLTAQLPEVLARSQAGSDSDGEEPDSSFVTNRVRFSQTSHAFRDTGSPLAPCGRPSQQGTPWRAPLWTLHRALGVAIGEARRAGDEVRAAALTDAIRALAIMIAADKPYSRFQRLRIERREVG